ncbi:hypothetical protein KOW79_002212 [Hemibagrus wyckioides]|uniref:Uncharacterized protein n=1 Tax=Hemibagrus wyckioides TaxID=337641 RepID=A0A9D3P330_9TELE|nr:uncharacterized protein LOC131347690 [Hemibagrus wyckioides]XP_058237997.1 uncharacterized protein LOC131347690 [Hemibagrus wyckioides]XP_058238007.1 uncharacterized protein LOC131347690 [Hemibagrus wyckioides]KAG7333805.1 hypothetical protein KOW79_002212 [Hemibagrus wyckioides]
MNPFPACSPGKQNLRKMQGFWILLLAVHIISLHLDSCAAFTTTKTNHEELMYGQQLSIRLPAEAYKLEFMSVDRSETEVLWTRFSITKKGIVLGSNSNKEFVLRSVTFEDQGTYTLFNHWNQKLSIHLLKVVAKRSIQNCVAGESLNIYLSGLAKNDATLHFSNQDFSLTLVERGSPVGNLHPEYMGRVQVTKTSIEVLNVNVSDVGNYTLSDRLNRTIKIISMNLVDYPEGVNAAPFMGLLMLLGIPSCMFCYCRKKGCRKNSQPTTTTINTTTNTVNYDNQINPPGPPPGYPAAPTPGYSPGYPAVGESIVHPPPNPTFPPQQPYSGYPATSPAMPPNPGYSPGYPAVGESIVHPPPNPTFPPQQPYSGYPATSPAMPPNPVPQNPAMYTGANIFNSSDSAVQFSINMGKDSSSNFL